MTRAVTPFRIHRSVVLLSVLSIGGGALPLKATLPTRSETTAVSRPSPEELNEVFSRWAESDQPGLSVAIMLDGQILLNAGYGVADLEHDAPITPTTIFNAGSISKQFTCFAIALLAAEGKLDLDDDIRDVLPEIYDFGTTITIRQLMYHTSGLRDQWGLFMLSGWRIGDVLEKEDALDLIFRQRELNFTPGTQHQYSNSGCTLLAEIVERVSGATFSQFTDEAIFQPLGMRNTHFQDDFRRPIKNRAESYQLSKNGEFEKSDLHCSIVGPTNLLTTSVDLMRWQRNLETGEVGGAAMIETMGEPGWLEDGTPIPYGLGLFHRHYRNRPVTSHTGAHAGFRSALVRFPTDRLSIAVLANTSDINPINLAVRIADLFFAQPVSEVGDTPTAMANDGEATPGSDPASKAKSASEPEVVEISAAILDTYTGTYWHEESAALWTVARDRGDLEILASGSQTRYVPITPTRFVSPSEDGAFEIEFVPAPEEGSFHVNLITPANDVMSTLARVEPPDDSAENLRRFVGVYDSAELEVRYRVDLLDGGLFLIRKKYGKAPLTPLYDELFEDEKHEMTLRFASDDGGVVEEFFLSGGRIQHLRFRKEPAPEGNPGNR